MTVTVKTERVLVFDSVQDVRLSLDDSGHLWLRIGADGGGIIVTKGDMRAFVNALDEFVLTVAHE